MKSYLLMLQGSVVALAIGTGIVAVARFVSNAIQWHVLFADFTVFWTAARFADVYNAKALTAAQLWALPPNPGLRPFPYPPSALLFLKPLAWADYRTAVIIWSALGILCLVAACRMYGRHGLLALLGPMFGLVIVTGQASLFLGAMLASGVALTKTRPAVAGVLFGLLGAIKPQLAMLVPIALICARHWTAVGFAMGAGIVAILTSLVLGPHLWIDWVNSLSAFKAQVLGSNFRDMNMAPGLEFAPFGFLSAGYVWTKTERPDLRLIAVVAGACLCVPYFGDYDLVAVGPAGGALLLGRDWRAWIVGFFGICVFWLSPVALAIGAAFLAYRSAGAGGIPEPTFQRG